MDKGSLDLIRVALLEIAALSYIITIIIQGMTGKTKICEIC